jgi:Glucose / Sorbosone dehydrogenase
MRRVLYQVVCSITLCGIELVQSNAATFSERIVGGFDVPTFATHAPGDANRLFVGRIWNGDIQVIDLNTRSVLPQSFLSIADLPNPLFNEQGLLGLAFDPDYAANGYFYVNYSGADNSLNVRRFRVLGDPATSNVADPNSGHTIINIPKDASWHNGGWIGFGPNDGFLYISTGDPGGGHAQLLTNSLHGKILRIDVRRDAFPSDPTRDYAVPASNPFVGNEALDEIWAYGLRNPWRASFDRETGDLWINDVGELAREEVNLQPAGSSGGENYGWPRREGTLPTSSPGPPNVAYTEPIYDYSRDDPNPLMAGAVIAASGLYRGPVAEFAGHYLFTDFATGNIWKLDPDAVNLRASVTNINHRLLPDVGAINKIAAFGEDVAGNLYLMDYDSGNNGEVFRLATSSQKAVWNGSDTASGAAGDGSSWSDAKNWSRGGSLDTAFAEQDDITFVPGGPLAVIDLGADRTAAAVTFASPYALEGHTLRLMSGNVTVEDGVTAIVRSNLVAESPVHSIRKLGGGTLVIDGNAGQVSMKAGTLGGTGMLEHLTVRDGATVAPGESSATAGILAVSQSLTMHEAATLAIDIAGRSNADLRNAQFDQLLIGGTAKLSGTLTVGLFDLGSGEFSPVNGDSFPILSAGGGITGSFDVFDLPPLSPNLIWQSAVADTTFFLTVAPRLPGDYNASGIVDAADYIVWRNTVAQSGVRPAADGTGPAGAPDGVVDHFDYQFWRANFGKVESGATTTLNVPEPEWSIAFICLGGVVVTRRLGRHQHPRVEHFHDAGRCLLQVRPRVAIQFRLPG